MIDKVLRAIFFNQWAVALVVSALLLLAAEVGHRLGLRTLRRRASTDEGRGAVIEGGLLGLLGLLLGFTFAMAAGRYDTRRGLVLDEANAIGTTYLRASFLPAPHDGEMRALLRRYVDARLELYDAGEDEERRAAAERSAAVIHGQLWALAVEVAKSNPTPLVVTVVSALNETIDLDAKRLQALRDRVPGVVWLLVLAVATCACCVSGFGNGLGGVRRTFGNFVFPLLIAVVITLIADLGRPHGGLIRMGAEPLLDLRESFREKAE